MSVIKNIKDGEQLFTARLELFLDETPVTPYYLLDVSACGVFVFSDFYVVYGD